MPAEAEIDARQVAAMLAEAFADVPTADYLVPDRTERLAVVAGQFTILTGHAQTAGGIVTTGEPGAVDGAIVWFDHTGPGPVPEIPDYQARLREACGAHTDRFLALEAAMEGHHPAEAHHYLALVGTRPELQGTGIATALLTRIVDRLDQTGTPGYLEAVSETTARLYERFGFERSDEPFPIGPGGPPLYPMWRTPRTPRR